MNFYNEIDPYCAEWLRNLIKEGHIADGIVDERSIEDITPADLEGFTQVHCFAGIGLWSLALRRAGVSDDTPVWTGSCPCQPFSAAGEGKGFADERHLWPAWNHLIGECRPVRIFGEQVASKDGLGWLDLVSADLEGQGYAVGAFDLCAAGFGAFHIRQRLYFTGVADDSRSQGRFGVSERGGQRAIGSGGLGGHRVADADCGRCGEISVQGPRQTDGAHSIGAATEPSGNRGIDGLADTSGEGSLPGAHRGLHRGEEGTGSRDVEPERHSDASFWLEHASGQRRLKRGTEPSGRGVVGGCGPEWVGNTDADGCQPGNSLRPNAAQQNPQHDGGAVWHYCRDGKYRPIPVEPEFFPLADGRTNRVGKLRAYGNAIHVETAVGFIRAAMT